MVANSLCKRVSLILTLVLSACSSQNHLPPLGIGKPIQEEYLRNWNIDVRPTGAGLPAGSGSAVTGEPLYQQQCASCHGNKGQGAIANRLVGGGNLNTDKPIKTVGSFWPYPTTLFDYIKRAMPYQAPQSLSNDQVYALSAYILYLNNIIQKDDVIDAKTLRLVKMPNRDGFIPIE
jgi:cytochrome c